VGRPVLSGALEPNAPTTRDAPPEVPRRQARGTPSGTPGRGRPHGIGGLAPTGLRPRGAPNS